MLDVADVPDLHRCLAGIADGLAITASRRLGNRDDANDAVQETLTRLWIRFRTLGVPPLPEVAPIAWGIARHVITDMLRDRGRAAGTPDLLQDAGPLPLDVLVTEEDAMAARRAIAALPKADRELLVRCFVNGERVVDIAATTGEPAERIRKRKSRAMTRLAVLLDRSDATHGHRTAPTPMARV